MTWLRRVQGLAITLFVLAVFIVPVSDWISDWIDSSLTSFAA
jgi:hypothetical protein